MAQFLHQRATCGRHPDQFQLLGAAAGGSTSDIRLQRLRTVDSQTAKQILRLMNRTLAEETTIGFPGSIVTKLAVLSCSN